MLTRSQVAKRLGRSVSTVRRLEGHALHPTQDARGVNRFDESEVEALALQVAETGSVPLPDDAEAEPWLEFQGERDALKQARADEVADYERRLDDERRRVRVAEARAGEAERRASAVMDSAALGLLKLARRYSDAGEDIEELMEELATV